MFEKISTKFLCVAVMLFCSVSMVAQESEGTYTGFSPYSIFGVGNISKEGTSYNRFMGGTGIASRTKRFVNILNPAAVTCRDSLSFMADFTLTQDNKIFEQGGYKTVNNTFNLHDLIISFPVYRSSAMYFGIAPYSSLGYELEGTGGNMNLIGKHGDFSYSSKGNGGIYQVFAGAGATFWRRFSVGAQAIFYFGNMDKKSTTDWVDPATRDIYSGQTLSLRGSTLKIGTQYEYPLGKNYYLTLGATYKFGADIKGYVDDFRFASMAAVTDTLKFNSDTLQHHKGDAKFAGELGLGVSLKYNDKWSVELDYIQSNWSGCGMDKIVGFKANGNKPFTATSSKSLRLGMEYVPNRNDIRYYFRRCSYRAGAYFDKDYFKVGGKSVTAKGITLGITFPVFRFYNGISLGVDFGERSAAGNGMISEKYANLTIGFNMYDIWFRKHRYD